MTNRFIATLDDLSRKTGIPAIAEGKPRRRLLRWTPVVSLVLATGGWAWGLVSPQSYWLGYGLIMLGWAIGIWRPLFGPIKPWGGAELADERDRTIRHHAFFVGFATISLVAMALLWLLVGLSVLADWPRAVLQQQLVTGAWYLMTLYVCVPTLASSWATRPLDPIDDEA